MLEKFYALERSGWKGDEGSAIDCSPSTRQFYDELARSAAKMGRLSMYVLEQGGRVIAMQYGLRTKDRYFINKPAYDEAYAQSSPGHILLHKVLEDCAARGMVELDFLGAWMPWKGEWTDAKRRHEFCFIFHKGVYGSLLHATKFRLAPFAKEKIIPATQELLGSKETLATKIGS
jgi:CelD/BcsL family acetyltransferase involved in cellulose biosynthesis